MGYSEHQLPSFRIDVVEPGFQPQKGFVACEIGQNLSFSIESLESYFFSRWEPRLYDALLVAAAVEFCDRSLPRPVLVWSREFAMHIPVHDPALWNETDVRESLQDALQFLTGDRWHIEFRKRRSHLSRPRQGQFDLSQNVRAVIPFSDGLDSCIVAALMEDALGDSLARVRLGSQAKGSRDPFTAVPYRVREGTARFRETSARSRGFKFALISGAAAYLASARDVIVSESGQGALGPSLVPVGQAYVDYRSHPLFTRRMERFLRALLEFDVQYQFPRLWFTKGETLASYVQQRGMRAKNWVQTRSCWQQARQISVDGEWRQCGICAACMLRRLSVHAANLREPQNTYAWTDLRASEFAAGAAAGFDRTKITAALREYAIAGALHLDHLASVRRSPINASALRAQASQLSHPCGLSTAAAHQKLVRLLSQHESEWTAFVASLGHASFIREWALAA